MVFGKWAINFVKMKVGYGFIKIQAIRDLDFG